MRPVNVASAPTSGQTGRKEAAKRGKVLFWDTPDPGRGQRPSAHLLFDYFESSALGWKLKERELMQ